LSGLGITLLALSGLTFLVFVLLATRSSGEREDPIAKRRLRSLRDRLSDPASGRDELSILKEAPEAGDTASRWNPYRPRRQFLEWLELLLYRAGASMGALRLLLVCASVCCVFAALGLKLFVQWETAIALGLAGHRFAPLNEVLERLHHVAVPVVCVLLVFCLNLEPIHHGHAHATAVRQNCERYPALQHVVVWKAENGAHQRSVPGSPHSFCKSEAPNFEGVRKPVQEWPTFSLYGHLGAVYRLCYAVAARNRHGSADAALHSNRTPSVVVRR